MSALELAPPRPRVLRTTSEKHRDCDGAGCFECGYLGSLLVEVVACPEHGVSVARNAETGTLLGCCDGCMAEAARAIQFLSANTTRVGGSLLDDSAADARRESL